VSTSTIIEDPAETGSIFQSKLPLETKLERARTELLDLSARNRLLNMPRSTKSARILQVIGEQSAEIYRVLVREGRAVSFLPGRTEEDASPGSVDLEDDGISEGGQPEEEVSGENSLLTPHADNKLRTRLTPVGLQKRLLDLYYDARTLEEEQGVNILFLALGALKWIDRNNAANIRHAPLVLVPVMLERGNAGEKFKLKWRQEDPAANLSLELFLDRLHGLKMPAFESGDDFDFETYVDEVAETVVTKQGWAVERDDVTLGFFSFAKFLMYRDLDPEMWPQSAKISEHPLIRGLVSDGFQGNDDLISEDCKVDDHLKPSDMLHIVDADSSQTLAIHEVRRNRNMVIQGPPGTGKSQTIANIIACAVADGKTVLFVAEKMAALEVVKRRLDIAGVGDACIELHSNKANKKAILEELRRTLELGVPKGNLSDALNARLLEMRNRLNGHAERMHRPHGAAGKTPYEIVGHLTRLKQDGHAPNDIKLIAPEAWSADELKDRFEILRELVEHIDDTGLPVKHVWRGIGVDVMLPPDVDRLVARIRALADRLDEVLAEYSAVAMALEKSTPECVHAFDEHARLAHRIAGAPALSSEALGAPEWNDRVSKIRLLLRSGAEYAGVARRLAGILQAAAWSTDVSAAREKLRDLADGFSTKAFDHAGRLTTLLPRLLEEAANLTRVLGREKPMTLAEIEFVTQVGERVAAAPEASSEALLAAEWETGIERAGDLAKAVAILESARAEIGSKLLEVAWSLDLRQARGTLAVHGTGLFKVFSREWRSANRLIRSVLADPKTPLAEVLPLLDALAKGRAAREAIVAGDQFGRSVFGPDWRGENSASRPLAALVDWMRTLRGIGAEPRIIAARRPDRKGIGARTARVRPLLEDAKAALQYVWNDCADQTAVIFEEAFSAAQADLAALIGKIAQVYEAYSLCRGIMTSVPSALPDCRRVLDDIACGQIAAGEVSDGEALGRAAFGGEWHSIFSDWNALHTAADWIEANLDIRMLASRIENRRALVERADAAAGDGQNFLTSFSDLLDELRCNRVEAFGGLDLASLPLQQLVDHVAAWVAGEELLSKWIVYRACATRARSLGIGEIVDRLHDGRLKTSDAVPNFEMSYFEALFADLARSEPDVARFDGALHDRAVREFVDFDRQRIKASAFEVVRAHHRKIPRANGGAVGPLGVLRSEIARRRGHMPIRQLIHRAAPALQALKPVFMMSPLSVAQFLPPGALSFDLVVMDEASQIQPVDALGAIARSRQVVVVGDPQQLPPTTFFAKITGGEDDEDEEGARLADIESILGLFTARGLPTRMLRWHYRSRHESLIAVSNKQFYGNKLFIVPSPYTAEAGMGLRFHFIENGIFESGTTRTNPVEAKTVARAIVAHAIQHPNLSLGVAAFSAAQRRAIQDQLELLRRQLLPRHEAFFQAHPSEPFFIKNLENVQGDERDVIFISVGYGPVAPSQKPPMRFGPLGVDGGERRLNVLISRAKRRCEVFSSITDEDIDLDFASASSRKGVLALKMFLHFARTGQIVTAETTGRDHGSIFEEQVAKALHARGYTVHRQVGIAGFFIDLAVADPELPGRYILGIECDGASYHSSRSARDRDRLRQLVLEDHGWIIHRIWSTDWFKRPRGQLERVISAITAAKAELGVRSKREATPVIPDALPVIEREPTGQPGADDDGDFAAAEPYQEAMLSRPRHLTCELHEAPTGTLSALAEEVVTREGPVHTDEVVDRIREAWGLRRSGARIQEAVERAIAVAVRQQRLEKEGKFLSVPGARVKVRDRSEVRSAGLRRPEMLPPAELRQAALEVIASNFGASDDQIALAVSRALGFKATSGQIRDAILKALERGISEQLFSLEEEDGLVVLGPAAPQDHVISRQTPVEKLVAEGEHEQLEFKQTLRWDVEQKQHNKALEEVAIKTIAAFANGNGGTLIIGVSDTGGIVGLEADFQCTGGNRDKFELHLTNLITHYFGQVFAARKIKVTFPVVRETQICRIEVRRATRPLFVTISDKKGRPAERFFVRSGNSSRELSASEVAEYVKERFK
jgi:very-short-patch-repair endonuclease